MQPTGYGQGNPVEEIRYPLGQPSGMVAQRFPQPLVALRAPRIEPTQYPGHSPPQPTQAHPTADQEGFPVQPLLEAPRGARHAPAAALGLDQPRGPATTPPRGRTGRPQQRLGAGPPPRHPSSDGLPGASGRQTSRLAGVLAGGQRHGPARGCRSAAPARAARRRPSARPPGRSPLCRLTNAPRRRSSGRISRGNSTTHSLAVVEKDATIPSANRIPHKIEIEGTRAWSSVASS
jgi:hypothetical protein